MSMTKYMRRGVSKFYRPGAYTRGPSMYNMAYTMGRPMLNYAAGKVQRAWKRYKRNRPARRRRGKRSYRTRPGTGPTNRRYINRAAALKKGSWSFSFTDYMNCVVDIDSAPNDKLGSKPEYSVTDFTEPAGNLRRV